jgi:hypothetical protein
MYGTQHCIDMDADQNGQHLTFQVTLLQLKIVNPKPFCNLCKARTKRGNKTLYMDLSILILTIFSSCYMTHLKTFIYDFTYRKLSKPPHIKMPDQGLTAVSRSDLHTKFEQRSYCDT